MNIHITDNFVSTTYPVGEYLPKNIKAAYALFDYLIKFGKEDIESHSSINFIGRGSSCTIFSTLICSRLLDMYPEKLIKYIYLMKGNEEGHNHGLDTILISKSLNIFVDDFVFSGHTIRKCLEHIRRHDTLKNFSFDYLAVGGSLYEVQDIEHLLLEYNVTKNVICNIIKEAKSTYVPPVKAYEPIISKTLVENEKKEDKKLWDLYTAKVGDYDSQ